MRLFLALLCCRSCCSSSSFFFSSIECHMCRRRKKKSISLCNQFSSRCDCAVPRYTRFTLYTRTHRTHFIRCSCRRNRRENRSVELLLNTHTIAGKRKAFSGEKKCISKPHKLHAREAQQNTTPRKNSHRDILPQKCPSFTTA